MRNSEDGEASCGECGGTGLVRVITQEPPDDDERECQSCSGSGWEHGCGCTVDGITCLEHAACLEAEGREVTPLTAADAAHINAALNLPDQPERDWSEFTDPDEAGRKATGCHDCGGPMQDSDDCRHSGLCLLCLCAPGGFGGSRYW